MFSPYFVILIALASSAFADRSTQLSHQSASSCCSYNEVLMARNKQYDKSLVVASSTRESRSIPSALLVKSNIIVWSPRGGSNARNTNNNNSSKNNKNTPTSQKQRWQLIDKKQRKGGQQKAVQHKHQDFSSSFLKPTETAVAEDNTVVSIVPHKLFGMPRSSAVFVSVAISAMLGLLGYQHWELLRPFLDKHYIQETALSILQHLESQPGALWWYALGMAFWEFVGLSTIPVETAAGMVFGIKRGFIASGSGKMIGAALAFGMGRSFMSEWVRTRLAKNTVWSTIDKSTEVHPPLVVAMLMKFSCFPEFVKNFGSACLDMPFAAFAVATCCHGLLYTLLWTALGVDATNHLENPTLTKNTALQLALVTAALVGFVGSPLLMAWWIRDMTRHIASTAVEDTKTSKRKVRKNNP